LRSKNNYYKALHKWLFYQYHVYVKRQDLQKMLFEEIVFDNDFRKIKKIQDDVKENYDLNNAKIYKTYTDINDVIYKYLL